MKKVLNRVISQVIAIMISVQIIGQYGTSFLPLVNAVGNKNESNDIDVWDEALESQTDVEDISENISNKEETVEEDVLESKINDYILLNSNNVVILENETIEIQNSEDNNTHRYQLFNESRASWTDAKRYCEELGGHLVTINSEEELNYIKQLILNDGHKKTYYIGLYRDLKDNKMWRWVTDEPLEFTNWDKGEPSNNNETCVHMYGKDMDFGYWNDTLDYASGTGNWSTSNAGFICEWETESSTDIEPVNNLTVSEIDATSAKISWNASENSEVIAYQILRNGEQIYVTCNTEFVDNELVPETEYIYEVYAFDINKHYSKSSDKLYVVTEKDTERPSIPQNFKVHSRTGSSITIMWNPSADNVETVGYKIFRNDEEIAEVISETVYKDTKLVADKEYTYKIKAYDAAGNCSDFSDSVSSYPVKPSIKEILPKNNSKIGGKTQRITVTFPDTGNSTGNKVKFEYKESGSDEYIPISDQLIGQKKYSYETLSAECDWDLTGLNGSYNVRATLYDADENSCSKEVEYTVDSSGSAAPADFKAESNNGLIILTWTPSVSANCDKYIIYRSDKEAGKYTELAVISKKETVRYVDKTVKIGGTYFYKIEAVSNYGIAGSPSDAVSAKVAEDKEIPNVSEILPLKSRVNKTAEITVNATDNISVEKIKLEYKSDDSDEWTLIKEEQATDGKAVFKWDTSKLEDGEYTVRAFAFDGSGNCSEEFIKKYTADNTGIGKIKIIADECTASSSFVSIRWEDVTENDFGWFAVEKKDDSGKFIEVGKSSQITGMHVENLQPDTDYVFRVVGYDDLGNKGEESDEITLTTTSDSINPAIRSFYPASSAFNSEINISINAADNIGIKNMKLRYSYDSADEKKWTELASVDASRISTDKTLSYKFDISELPEGEIYVEAVVSDTSGNKSEPCINKYKIDRTAPNAINDLNADGSGGSVHLTWTVSDDDIKSFEIYRCEDEKGVYSRITTCFTKDYYDISAKFGCTYTYKVIAVDIAGNRSADSNEAITQVADDITAPSVLGFRYSSGTVLPANPSFSVVASDNYKLSKAEIEYRKSDSEDGIWYELCTLDMNSSYQSVDFRWDTENLIEGKYILKAVVYDAAGNISEPFTAEYTLDLTAPSTPDIEAIQGNWELTVNWGENTEDDFDFYRLYRKSDSDSKYICLGDTRENNYTDTDVSPEKMYSYKIEAYDKCGNHSENTSNSVRPDNTDTFPPQANVSEQLFGITDSEVAFDGSESTDNVRISKFVWDFGDGSKGYGVRTVHMYKKAGTYEAELTVYDDAGFSDSSTFTVTVYDRTKYGNMQIEVTDDSGRPLKYAYVYLYSSEKDSEISIRADSNGIANISALTGKHQIAAYKDGYLPVKKEVEINSVGNNNKIRIALQSGELVTGNLSVHRMSLEEMVEAGIDFNNPANYHSYSFTIELTFAQEPIPTVIQYIHTGGTGGYGGSGGFGGGGFIGGSCSSPSNSSSNSVKLKDGSTVKIQPIVYDSPEIEEEIPILAYVRTTQNISFMKDMYAVDLGVINNASSEFVIKNCSATLNLPDGLSLAATTKKQSLIQDMGDIAGQEKKTISWAVKGDKKGEYNLNADFSGTLMPFNAPVRANFQTDEPFRVGAGDGIVITVMPESAAYIGENYYIQFSVSNTGSDTFYNLKTSFGDLIIPGEKIDITVTDPEGNVKKYQDSQPDIHIDNANKCKSNLVIYGNQMFEIGTFEPGDVIYGTLVSGFSAEGDPEEVYYKLIDYIVEEHNKDTNVRVVVSPIASHITKYNVKQQYVTDTWGDPVDMTTGGFIDSLTAMSVTGDSSLDFNLDYNSINSAESRELGYGWSHNFETYLEKSQGGINVHWSPSNYSLFIDEDSKNGNIKGTVENDCIKLTESEDIGAKGYLPVSTGFDGYRLYRDEQGIYTLTAPGGAKNVFDQDGRLIQIVNANGKKINIERNGNTAVISEEITGVNLILTYNDLNQVTSVEDGNGRKSTISYENGCISSVTNASGNTVSYEYDGNNRLISATVEGDELPYVVNKYDENGRVIEQDDGDENTPLTYFYYDENEKNGTLTVTATDRNNIYDAENKKNSHQVQYVSDWLGHVISFTDQNGGKTVYTYDSKGNLTSATDASGNKTVYTYDKNGWVTSIKDSAGNMSQITYDSNGNITSVTGPNGEKSSYTYNENNLLVKSVENSGVVKEYEYNENAQLINETVEGIGSKSYNYTDGRITSVTDFMGNVSETAYDAYGNVASMTDRDGNKTSYVYDELNRLISQTTADGTVSYTYDSRGNKISATDTRDNTVNYSYNGNNFMTQLKTVKGITKYDYDNEGRLIAQTAPDGTVFRNEYDPVGNVIKSVNENGEICEYTYDATGNVKTKTLVNGTDRYTEKYEYYAGDKLKKVTFADGTSESYEYDSSWRLTKVTDELGNSSVTEYDGSGNVLSVTDAEGNKTQYTYDKYGRILTATDPNGNVTTFDKYDANGNCLQETLPSGQIICMTYSNEGLLLTVTMKCNDGDISISYEYDASGRVTNYIDEEGNEFITEYDSAGNVVKLLDAKGNTIQENTYDELSYLVSSTDALGIETQYNYDVVGNLIKTIESINTAREAETSYEYDKIGRIIQSVDAENGKSAYEYDAVGNIIAQIDPNGGRSEYRYDSMGRIIESISPLGSKKQYTYNAVGLLEEAENARGQKTEYTYYKNGWIKSFTDEIGTVSYTYDGNGNVLTVTDENGTITREYNSMNQVTKYTDFRGNTIKYSYDQIGNLVALTYPGGRIVRYSYYKNGNIKTVTDWDGRVTSYEYDGNSRLTKTTRPDGSVETRTYDAAGRMTSKVDVNGDTIISHMNYSYDESGNITNIDTTNAMGVTGLSSAEMVYNENNQLVKYNGKTVKYDADGNMIYGPLNGEMADFKYDCRNRLISAGGTTYAYDAENNRISKTVNNIKTEYVIDSTGSLTRVLTASTEGKTTYFVYGIGLISQEDDSEILYYHFNNIGSTEAVTSLDGKIKEKFEYGPYGELTSENKCGIIFLYNGEYGVSTDENGLYYMRARYYNSEIKRFINQDVLTGSIIDSPTLNRYAYVEGNPISLADPFGLSPAINWRSAGHTILGLLGLLTFVPGLNWVGIAANAVNAAWYFSEGNIYEGLCSAVGVFGGGYAMLGKAGTASCGVMNFLKYGTAVLSVGAGGYDMYTIGKKNYDAALHGEGLTLKSFINDTVRVVFDSTSIAGGIKLATEPIPYCFVAGTLVETEDGQKSIEEIQAGDKVLSENPETGEIAYKTVEETYINETDELIHVHVNGETISATPSHPFYVDKLGWTLAKNLRAGDIFVLSNGEFVVVEWVQHEILESPVKVYNFKVEDFHTYFVGESSVLVHNQCTELTRKQQHQIEDLRSGKDVSVKTVDEARTLLDNMPEVSAPPLGRMNPEFPDPKGTYRGDLFNAVLYDELGNAYLADFIHDPSIVQKNPLHAQYPHYNIYFPDGEKAAILITG